ncbi:helix-turn-helix domain-containing protein [Flavobacteriaceae bacterium R38]|nr:helix-turn-helix domain-containing protein [Flavobacteriaceae bacterium R38]
MRSEKTLPILNIGQFRQKLNTDEFYSNSFVNHTKQNKNLIFKPHSHNFFLCVLFTNGLGTHEIDFNTYPIQPGSVFFLKPGQTHHWKFTDTPEGYIFFHTQDFYELCFLNSNLSQFPFYFTHENPPTLNLNKKEVYKLELLFKEINIEYRNDAIYKYEKLNSLINQIYIDLARCYTSLNPNKSVISKTYLNILEQFQNTLEDFFKVEKSVAFYADKLNITTKHLNRVTKSTLDKTSSTIIKERLLLEAKRLLVHSKSPLSSIATQLGFYEYSYFSKIFKNNVGITPYDFRKKY